MNETGHSCATHGQITTRVNGAPTCIKCLDEKREHDRDTLFGIPAPGGRKDDGGKSRLDLIPVGPVLDIGNVLAFGAAKYGERNWEKGIAYGRLYSALLRHLFAFWGGEELDPESGLPHLAHAGCCLLMLAATTTFDDPGNLDDRPGPKLNTTTRKAIEP